MVRDVTSTGTIVVVDNWSRFNRGSIPMAELWTLDENRLKKWVAAAPSSNVRVSPNLALIASVGELKFRLKGQMRGLFVKATADRDTDAEALDWNRVVAMDLDEETASVGQQISWSPASDRIATTLGSKIAIVRILDGRVEYIAEGRSPKWSRRFADGYESPASELVIRDMALSGSR
jgi:hypothetical protein